jgi:hypothetical protein
MEDPRLAAKRPIMIDPRKGFIPAREASGLPTPFTWSQFDCLHAAFGIFAHDVSCGGKLILPLRISLTSRRER